MSQLTDAAKEMVKAHLLHGVFDIGKAGLPASFWLTRRTNLDCRGPLKIHPSTYWGYHVMVITRSHDISTGQPQLAVDRGVTVDEGAWICNRALLYNCHVGQGAVVAAGAVVRSTDVEPYTMVAGNPARLIKRFTDGKWVRA